MLFMEGIQIAKIGFHVRHHAQNDFGALFQRKSNFTHVFLSVRSLYDFFSAYWWCNLFLFRTEALRI